MNTPQQTVFDIPELRKIILTHVVRDKYRSEIQNEIKHIVSALIVDKWFLYCTCELCENKARDYYMGI